MLPIQHFPTMTSITKNKIKRLLLLVVPIVFWIGIWQLSAMAVNHSYLFPDVPTILKALVSIITAKTFFQTVLLTLIRVLTGLALGVILGIILAVASHYSEIVNAILTPIISIVKSTPVASFIVILWISLSGDALAVSIAVLMVMPIVWQNLMDGFNSIDNDLSELCDVYRVGFIKRMRLLIIPALTKYLIPGIITASGLAWKSEIAAEIIAYTKRSIGQHINDAKYFMDTPSVFAWTLIIIILSIILENITKILLKRYRI